MIPLLVLRPQPGATATVARAEVLGLRAIAAPLFTIEPMAWHPPPADTFDALMITSANAVRQAGAGLRSYRHLPIYAVGAATAAALHQAGFEQVKAGDRDVAVLIAEMAADGIRQALHLGGEIIRTASHPGLSITQIPVYRAVPVETLPDTVQAPAVALLHSPRAAETFARFVDPADRPGFSLAAISRATAEAASEGWRAVAAAPSPTDDALLALAARLCDEYAGVMSGRE